MDDWEIHFREKSSRRAKRRRYDPNLIGIVAVAGIAMLVFLLSVIP